MAYGQSTVWCMDTAPLCSLEVQALWAQSPSLNLFSEDPRLASVEPAADMCPGRGLSCPSLEYLESNQVHSRRGLHSDKGTVPGTEPAPTTALAE